MSTGSLNVIRRHPITCCVLLILTLGGCAQSAASVKPMGAYRLEDGRVVSIRRSTEDALRYRFYENGESGRLYRMTETRYVSGAGFSSRSPVNLTVDFEMNADGRVRNLSWTDRDGPVLGGSRIGEEESISFESDGARLSARLDLPAGPGPHPAIVLLHGSGSDAGTEYLYNGDFFAAHGIAALVYDKRGTGRSEGTYTFDYEQLARDAVAAVQFLKARSDIDPERIGLAGYSQGGWVAPLAASLSEDVRFVLVSYGMIESAVEEARLETRNLVRKRGVAEEFMPAVDELTVAAVHVVATDFREGWDEFAAAKKKHKNAPWTQQLHGSPVAGFLKYPRWLVKMVGRRKAPNGLSWYYDSSRVLDDLTIPMAWFLGEADESAPNELTIPTLRRLRESGKPYELILFPDADHTMLIFDERDGERIYSGYAPGYFRAEVEHARRLAGL